MTQKRDFLDEGGKKLKHEISMKDIKESKCDTFEKKDDSVRGCSCVSASSLKIGDEVVINNYFTRIVEETTVEKWKRICLEADNVASEVLASEDAKNELSAEEMREILKYTGDDEFVNVSDDGTINNK